MTSYFIHLDEDILKLDCNQDIPASGDRIIRDVQTQLDQLIDSEQLQGGPLLKISGASSVLASYAMGDRVGHLYGAIAEHSRSPELLNPSLFCQLGVKINTSDRRRQSLNRMLI